MTNDAWAHTQAQGEAGAVRSHGLADHLQAVGAMAAAFAAPFGPEWAALAGLWHDLGKYRAGFQNYIRLTSGADAHIERTQDRDKTHSAAGALWAERFLTERHGPQGRMMARVLQYVIAGHHAGLDNWEDGLASRLASSEARRELEEALSAQPAAVITAPKGAAGLQLRSLPLDHHEPATPGRFALWLRLLFSALVDADFLDTEAFMDVGKARARSGAPTISVLKSALDNHMAALAAGAADTPVNRLRAGALQQCRAKAAQVPGVFTLTVPTGGGKTLASLSFALDHACHHPGRHGQRRVIYAIPYTSIIEQTADVFRSVFAALGEDSVVEHHSNAESAPERETARSRLAGENWDAPIVVTTNVQLFESLFARRTSRCRKLHNLVGSVIVLDEAQLLPVEFLQPIVDVLGLLVRDHGVTLVLCTATQPVLTRSTSADPERGLQRGFDADAVTEIIDDVPALYAALERVRVHLPANLDQVRDWPDLAAEIGSHDAVLAIVSRRADARMLFDLLRQDQRQSEPGACWHLSALMCARHRSDVIAEAKAALRQRREALAAGEPASPVRVVSTQLVEAGVDLDFPVVYRALAGLDSIAQAAGRCNREGLLAGLGDVHVFVPPTAAPPGLLRQARDTCKLLWSERPEAAFDPFALPMFKRYFERLYGDRKLDEHGICEALRLQPDKQTMSLPVRFRDAAEKFRLIDDKDTATVLVRYRSPNTNEDIDALIGTLERDGPSRWLMRKLQRHGVTIYSHQAQRLAAAGDIREVAACPGLYVQTEGWDGFYDPLLGARVDGAPGDPATLVL